MGIEHPTFPNPTIQEALCEIHFRLADGVAWPPSLLAEFSKQIQPDFPNWQPVSRVGFRLDMGLSGLEQRFLPPQQQMQYRHATRNLLLQLSEGMLTVNELPMYPGWLQMQQDVLYAWRQLRGVTEPSAITRIGLRYINRVERTHPDERPGDWIAPSRYVAESVLSSLPGFFYRSQVQIDTHNRLVVTLGEIDAKSSNGPKAIVLDIDCIVERIVDTEDIAIAGEITRLHDLVWGVFSVSIAPSLQRRLMEQQQ